MTNDVLNSAIGLIKAGKKIEARKILEPYIISNPHDIQAWIWEAEAQETPKSRIKVLETCLIHNPHDKQIQRALALLKDQSKIVSDSATLQVDIEEKPSPPSKINNQKPSTNQPAPTKTNVNATSSIFSKNKVILGGIIILTILIVGCGFVVMRLFGSSSTAGLTNSLQTKALSMPNHANCHDLSFSNLSYDVQKTNSLVSPYIGLISGNFTDSSIKFDFVITLAYQDNNWLPTKADTSSPTLHTSNDLDRNLLNAASNLLLSCLE